VEEIARQVSRAAQGHPIDFKGFPPASRAATESSLKIGATVGVIKIVIGVLTYTGLVLTFADIVIELLRIE